MKRLLQAISVLPEAMLLIHGNGIILGSNSAARELFGRTFQEGASLSSVVSDSPEKVLRSLHLWSSSRQFLPASLQITRGDDTVVIRCDGAAVEPATRQTPSLLLLRCIRRGDSTTTKFFIQLNEKIENLWKQNAEQKARDHNRLSSLATAAAVFAHEIANPLNGIGMSVQLLEKELLQRHDVSPFLRESIVEANKEIARLSSLLRDFRSFARTQFVEFQPTDLSKLVQEVLAPEMVLFSNSGVRVRSHLSGLPPIMLDPDKMKQVILNLCKNAVEAMPQGGCLTLKGYLSSAETVVLEVTDTGIGIREGMDIFEIFRTTKPDGTGLGLPLVSQIVSAHRGTVDYVSEPGKGTTFRLSLPVR
jgi:two-component system, NtrC family, sensor histidine kinase HydH